MAPKEARRGERKQRYEEMRNDVERSSMWQGRHDVAFQMLNIVKTTTKKSMEIHTHTHTNRCTTVPVYQFSDTLSLPT